MSGYELAIMGIVLLMWGGMFLAGMWFGQRLERQRQRQDGGR